MRAVSHPGSLSWRTFNQEYGPDQIDIGSRYDNAAAAGYPGDDRVE
jgi:hypothetical protein